MAMTVKIEKLKEGGVEKSGERKRVKERDKYKDS